MRRKQLSDLLVGVSMFEMRHTGKEPQMSLADELQKLAQLKSSGALSEEEFQQAKKKLLEQSPEQSSGPKQIQQASDKGSDRDDSLLIVLVSLALILILIILFGTGFHWWHWHRPYY